MHMPNLNCVYVFRGFASARPTGIQVSGLNLPNVNYLREQAAPALLGRHPAGPGPAEHGPCLGGGYVDEICPAPDKHGQSRHPARTGHEPRP